MCLARACDRGARAWDADADAALCRALALHDVRDVKRLYLSGNALPAGFLADACYNLVYLELAGCRLRALPPRLAALVPNVRTLNLNYNFIDDVRPLAGLTRLRRLTLVGSRVPAAKQFVRVLRGMLDVEMLDFRYATVFSFQCRVQGKGRWCCEAPGPCPVATQSRFSTFAHRTHLAGCS